MHRHCDLLLADVQDPWTSANTVTNQSLKGTLHLLSHLSPCWYSASPQRLELSMSFIPSSSSFPYLQLSLLA